MVTEYNSYPVLCLHWKAKLYEFFKRKEHSTKTFCYEQVYKYMVENGAAVVTIVFHRHFTKIL